MNQQAAATPDSVATRLWLGMQRYALLLIGPIVVFTAIGYIAGNDPAAGKYEASAVVVATDLKLRPEGLPRFAEAVFSGGEVARAASATLPYGGTDLIPKRVVLEPFENTVVLEVVATDADAELAMEMANEVAEAFVAELNQAGPTLGIFAIQSNAQVPEIPVASTSAVVALAVGVIAGGVLGVGLVMLMLLLRRPVFTASDIAAVTDAPVLATLRLPRGRELRLRPPRGTAAVARRLFPERAGMCGLISAGPPLARRQLAVLLADVLAPGGPVHLVTEADVEAARVLPAERVTVTKDIPPSRVSNTTPVIIDGPSEYDLPALYPPNARLALVLQSGASANEVAAVASEFLPGELSGVILVRRRWRLARLLPGAGAGVGVGAPEPAARVEPRVVPSKPAPQPTDLPRAQPSP